MKIIEANWYDYPQYYDVAFQSETRAEVDFFAAAWRRYCPFPVRRVLEPGCGSGRLVAALTTLGYQVTAFDLSRPSLDYLRRRLARRSLHAQVFAADMADFRIGRQVDAAVCTWNTFRHLITERAARSHLQCVANALRPGGTYILGLHLLPLDVADDCVERWSSRRGRSTVTVTLRVVATNRRRRIETLEVILRVRTAARDLRLRSRFPFRMYTAEQFLRLLASVPQLQLCDVYDFWFEIDNPLVLNDEITDTVFILRKADC